MTIATFKDLCMDATEAPMLAGFWARTLGGHVVDRGDGSARVDKRPGQLSNESIWVNLVPERRTGKSRVRLEVRLADADPAPLVAAGARVLGEPGARRWWVLADPEGNEFCALPPDPAGGPQPGIDRLVVDSADPATQARWWAGVVGGDVEPDGYGAAAVVGAAGLPWRALLFQPVSDPKTVKNRIHLDVDLTGPDCARLVEAGATIHRVPGGDIHWWVLTDPEGNEFCAFAPDDA
ncbi:MAG TPA: VOC family protein [Pilimelia sp.]|nr:VOC family protein [Pilimelia sp.]